VGAEISLKVGKNLDYSLMMEIFDLWVMMRFFLHQIKGAIVVDSLEKLLGEVVEIIETGAGYVYSVKQPNGGEFLVPSLGNIVQFFDIQNKKLIIDPIPGLLES
jgi:16S rRNA processing protein RimM